MGTVAVARRQLGVARRALGLLLRAPWTLAYPLLVGVVGVGLPVASIGIFLAFGPSPIPVLFGNALVYVVAPVVVTALLVAYCYEVNELLLGRRPAPGSGLAVVADRGLRVVVTALFLWFGTILGRGGGDSAPFAERFGVTSTWGLRVVGMFAVPAIATTRGPPRQVVERTMSAVESAWGRAAVATVGLRTVGVAITWAGILGGLFFFFANVGRDPLAAMPPFGWLTVPAALAVGGPVLAATLQVTAEGVVRTALYRYARDGQWPRRLSVGPRTVADLPSSAVANRPPNTNANANAGRKPRSAPPENRQTAPARQSGRHGSAPHRQRGRRESGRGEEPGGRRQHRPSGGGHRNRDGPGTPRRGANGGPSGSESDARRLSGTGGGQPSNGAAGRRPKGNGTAERSPEGNGTAERPPDANDRAERPPDGNGKHRRDDDREGNEGSIER